MGLLRFLIIAICILWLIRLVFRLLLPALIQGLFRKAARHQGFNAAPGPDQQQAKRKPEGRINIDYIPPKDKEAIAADRVGEFIDYEEIR